MVRDQEVVIVDANAYWRQHEAAQFIAALEDEPIYLEQPCRTLAECLAIRRRTARPMILDETLTDLDALFAAQAAGAMDCAMLKLSRLGGISRVRLARDVCRQWGLAMTMEDAGGGDVVTAAMAHLAASTPPQSLLNGMLINMMVNEHIAEGTPEPTRRLVGGVTPSRSGDHRGREGARRARVQHPLTAGDPSPRGPGSRALRSGRRAAAVGGRPSPGLPARGPREAPKLVDAGHADDVSQLGAEGLERAQLAGRRRAAALRMVRELVLERHDAVRHDERKRRAEERLEIELAALLAEARHLEHAAPGAVQEDAPAVADEGVDGAARRKVRVVQLRVPEPAARIVLLAGIHRALNPRGMGQDQVAVADVDPDPDLTAGPAAAPRVAVASEAALEENGIDPKVGQMGQPIGTKSGRAILTGVGRPAAFRHPDLRACTLHRWHASYSNRTS